jgi:hypothetical protein
VARKKPSLNTSLLGDVFGGPAEKMIDLEKLRLDGGTQPRAELDEQAIGEYAEVMCRMRDRKGNAIPHGKIVDRDNKPFPAITVFHDGTNHWLADGFHRVAAAKKAGYTDIQADVHSGTQRDAIRHSVGVNATHGKRRTNADKRRAVQRLLRDEEWGKYTDNYIAKLCKVSRPFAAKVRKELVSEGDIEASSTRIDESGRQVDVTENQKAGKKAAESRQKNRGVTVTPEIADAIGPTIRKPATVVVNVDEPAPELQVTHEKAGTIEVTSEQNSPSEPLVSHKIHIFETIERGVDPGRESQGADAVVLPWEKLMWVASRMKHTELENATSVPVFIEDGQRWFVVHMKSPAALSPTYATIAELRSALLEVVK